MHQFKGENFLFELKEIYGYKSLTISKFSPGKENERTVILKLTKSTVCAYILNIIALNNKVYFFEVNRDDEKANTYKLKLNIFDLQ